MKVVNIYLEDEEHKLFTERKGSKTWKEVLVDGLAKRK